MRILGRESEKLVGLRVFVLCVLAATLVIVGASQGRAAVLFEDDFESGTLNAWSEPRSAGDPVATTEQAHSGKHSVLFTYPRDDAGDKIAQNLGRSVEHFFLRWYEYFDSAYTFPVDQKLNRFVRENDFLIGMNVRTRGDTIKIEVDRFTPSHRETIHEKRFTFETGKWYCMEVEVQLNTPGQADGSWRVWIDTTLKLQKSDVDLRGTSKNGINRFWVGGPWSNLHVDPPRMAKRFVDDVVFSTTRVGCLPDVGDKIPPESPSGLRISSQ